MSRILPGKQYYPGAKEGFDLEIELKKKHLDLINLRSQDQRDILNYQLLQRKKLLRKHNNHPPILKTNVKKPPNLNNVDLNGQPFIYPRGLHRALQVEEDSKKALLNGTIRQRRESTHKHALWLCRGSTNPYNHDDNRLNDPNDFVGNVCGTDERFDDDFSRLMNPKDDSITAELKGVIGNDIMTKVEKHIKNMNEPNQKSININQRNKKSKPRGKSRALVLKEEMQERKKSYYTNRLKDNNMVSFPDSSFRRILRPTNANVNPPPFRTKSIGTYSLVRKSNDFIGKDERMSQRYLEKVIGRTSKREVVTHNLRPKILARFIKLLSSRINPPGNVIEGTLELHKHLQAIAYYNPESGFLSRQQLVSILIRHIHGLHPSLASQLVTCYDLKNNDKIRFARIVSDLVAANHPSMTLLSSRTKDQGPHQLILTVMRKAVDYFASDNGRKYILWYELFFMFRSYGCGWQQVYQIDDAIQNFIESRNISLESEIDPSECISMLKEDLQLLNVLQNKLVEFQTVVKKFWDEMINNGITTPRLYTDCRAGLCS